MQQALRLTWEAVQAGLLAVLRVTSTDLPSIPSILPAKQPPYQPVPLTPMPTPSLTGAQEAINPPYPPLHQENTQWK